MATDARPPSTAVLPDTLPVTSYTPLPVEEDSSGLAEPRAPFLSAQSPSPPTPSFRESYNGQSESGVLLANKEAYGVSSADGLSPPKTRRRPLLIVLTALVIAALIAVAVVVPVYFKVIKPQNKAAVASNGAPQPSSSSGSTPPTSAKSTIYGFDGSTVRASNGSTFTYNNKLGGMWYYDVNDPYSNNAYANSWSPPLNKSWNYGTDRIYGVNLGGWFVLEPFITPALFQRYPSAVDEWSLSILMAADTANGGLNQLEEHYKTFITEQDIADIAGAGLNWVRLPVPFWAIDVWGDEPFLVRTVWKYILQSVQWCRKYGIRIKLDLHTVPGSQNGYNHSGKRGEINFLMGTMGIANAQRVLNYIRIFTEFFSQPQWKDVVPMFGVINEPVVGSIGDAALQSFNYEAYRMIREITGIGEGHGPYISYHDGFMTPTHWAGFLTGADRIVIDTHPYFAFDSPASTDPIDSGTGDAAGGVWPARACTRWASQFNTSRTAFGVTVAGEWSVALNDCGLFVKGTTQAPDFGSCTAWSDSSGWSDGTKAGLMKMAMASMDSFRDWFFWTWKVGPSQRGIVEAPSWSYQLGLQGGWLPRDPRSAIGTCGASSGPVFNGQFESWMTGGAGAGQLRSTFAWPPASISVAPVAAAGLPSYTATGVVTTLPEPTYTNSAGRPIVSGSGWFNAQDTRLAPTPISGCAYPNPWDARGAAIPSGCGVAAAVPIATAASPATRTTTTSTTARLTTTTSTTATLPTDDAVVRR